ncbi:MAG: hypothetical protein M1831_004057 [Alyxoria varia]|nr:MAG: hypothetical protein M1831_004057 [Alyxoria varia]
MRPLEMDDLSISTLCGYFRQDETSTDPDTFEYETCHLGLIDRSYSTDSEEDAYMRAWDRFARYVNHLNDTAREDVEYKVLYLGRHGEGWHNVALEKYGDKAWDNYWSLLEGDESSNWSDALLTPAGRDQALTASKCFQVSINPYLHQEKLYDGVTATPQHFYVSPLARCLETARVQFAQVHLGNEASLPQNRQFQFRPTVKEMLREENGCHTCDRRSSRTWIEQHYPEYVIEPGFAEEDKLWSANVRESWDRHRGRVVMVLRDIFEELRSGSDGSPEDVRRGKRETAFISMTTHSGTIDRILEVIGHRVFPVRPGGILPVLVKIERYKDRRVVDS